jgi:transposase
MNNFEDQLDEIRIKIYEKTKGMSKDEIIKSVNSSAQTIADRYGIHIIKNANEQYSQKATV